MPTTPNITLGLDPSSKAIGYAALSGLKPSGLLRCGVIQPDDPKADADERIADLVAGVIQLVSTVKPREVIVETPAMHTHARVGIKMMGAAIYGYAVGRIYEAASWTVGRQALPGMIHGVSPDWTGKTSKAKRQAAVKAIYGDRYDPKQDSKDLDASDAISLARWWIETRAMREAE
jgi:Holliday junction resolvasome RuvABC endonuclease subunit